MNTLLNILPWVLAIVAGALYFFKSKEVSKFLDRLKFAEQSAAINSANFQKEFSRANELKTQIDSTYQPKIWNLESEKLDLEAKLLTAQYDNQMLQEANSNLQHVLDTEVIISPNTLDLRLFIEKYEDLGFVNSAVINLHSITLRDMEIIHENHINVIRSLAKKGYFRQDIADKFQYSPKTGEVIFSLLKMDTEGNPTAGKNWQDFLIERNDFRKTVTEYIEGVIGQREINRAVEEAIEGKEVASV
jgi:hypothetical protein